MKERKSDEIRRLRLFLTAFGIMALAILMLADIACAQNAYIAHDRQSKWPYYITIIDTNSRNFVDYSLASYPDREKTSFPYGVAAVNDGKVYITESNSSTLVAYSPLYNRKLINVGNWPTDVVVSPIGSTAYVLNQHSRNITIINTSTDTVIDTVEGLAKNPGRMAISPDGTTLYVTQPDNYSVSVIYVKTKKIADLITKLMYKPRDITVSPDGSTLYVSDSYDYVLEIDGFNKSVHNKIKLNLHGPNDLVLTPDGKKLYATGYGSGYQGFVAVIDTATLITQYIPLNQRFPSGIALTSDGTQAYVPSNWDHNVSVINTVTDKVDGSPISYHYGYPIAHGQFMVPPSNPFSNIKVVGINYTYRTWGQYPLINLFGRKVVPLFSNGNPIWKNHVNMVAPLVMDSNNKTTINTGQTISIGNGYTLQIKSIDVDGQKVWLELDQNGQYVGDGFFTGSGVNTLTQTVMGIPNVPILKVHIYKVNPDGTNIQIDGLWLIDSKKAGTLTLGQVFGNIIHGKIITRLINGIDEAFLGEIVYKNYEIH